MATSYKEILETLSMIHDENLDVRTVTMGISLLDCCDADYRASCDKIKKKIREKAGRLVSVCDEITATYGIPIINKRLSVTPISFLVAASHGHALDFARALDSAASDVGVNYIGGFSALVQKGYAAGDRELIDAIPEALASTSRVCASVNIGSTKAGINLDGVKRMGEIVRDCALLTKDQDSVGASKLVVFCNAVEDNPFMAGAFHGVGEPDAVINVGVSGPGVIREAVSAAPADASIAEIAEIIKKTAFKVTRMGQLTATLASEALSVPFGIVDLSLAPTPAVGDSVADILESIGLESVGSCGTTACLALLNDAVKKGGIMASSRVGGLSGAFIPVMEDREMAHATEIGALSIEKLEAMTAVCSVGLDMIPIPGDTPAEVIAAIIADEAAIGLINTKTTAVRVIPAIGKKEGDVVDYGGLFGKGHVMKVSTYSPKRFIDRGGQIPAPIQSLKN